MRCAAYLADPLAAKPFTMLQLQLPQDKLLRLGAQLGQWMGGSLSPSPRSGTKRELHSLVGLLNHVASVVQPGRTILCSLIDVSSMVKALDHHVHLGAGV